MIDLHWCPQTSPCTTLCPRTQKWRDLREVVFRTREDDWDPSWNPPSFLDTAFYVTRVLVCSLSHPHRRRGSYFGPRRVYGVRRQFFSRPHTVSGPDIFAWISRKTYRKVCRKGFKEKVKVGSRGQDLCLRPLRTPKTSETPWQRRPESKRTTTES